MTPDIPPERWQFALPHRRAKQDRSFTDTFIEKVCKVDFKIDDDNPHADKLIRPIRNILPRHQAGRGEEHMAKYDAARSAAKAYLDVEWKQFKSETGMKG